MFPVFVSSFLLCSGSTILSGRDTLKKQEKEAREKLCKCVFFLCCVLVFPLTRSKDELCVSRDIARYYCQGEQLGNGDGSIMSQSQGSACGTERQSVLGLFYCLCLGCRLGLGWETLKKSSKLHDMTLTFSRGASQGRKLSKIEDNENKNARQTTRLQ